MARSGESTLWGDWYTRSRQAKPFLRWAGGKHRFLLANSKLLPTIFTGSYIEPFVGGGSVFFWITRTQERPFLARLGDTNRHLIRCYIDIRDQPDEVTERLEIVKAGYLAAKDKAAFYYEQREAHNAQHPRSDTARFIFLNRTCWNGLWRENLRGEFNVPYGQPKTLDGVFPSFAELAAASAALAHANLRTTSWENTLALATPGDFVFLDPPYYSDYIDHTTERRTKYSKRTFGPDEHERLANALVRLRERSIPFVLTNSAEPEMQRLYKHRGFEVHMIRSAARAINSRGDERQGVPELVVLPGTSTPAQSDPGVLLELAALRQRKRSD